MIRIKKILHPTDFSRCADQALSHALLWASRFDAELHMLHTFPPHEEDPHNPAHRFPVVDQLQARLKGMVSDRMNASIVTHKAGEVKIIQTSQRADAPGPMILEYAKKIDADLIIMGTHGKRGLRHLLIGSVTAEVIRLADCPILTVREAEKPKPVLMNGKLLVPVDFSTHALKALDFAREIGAAFGMKMQLLHVFEEILYPSFYFSNETPPFIVLPELETRSKRELQKWAKKVLRNPEEAELHVVRGLPVRDIIRFAGEEHSDMIVIATHGLTGLEHLLLGSVTEKIVRLAQCPVFTVKTFGKSLMDKR